MQGKKQSLLAKRFESRKMKLREKILAFALIASVLGWLPPAFSQDEDSGGALRKEYTQDAKRLLSRVLQDPDSAPIGIRQDIIALREAQDLVRDAWVNEYRPAKGASVADVRAAREAFQADYAEQIKESRELRIRVLNRLREGVRGAIDEARWSDDARALYQEYKDTQAALDQAWQAVKAELGEDASRDQIQAAKRRFNEANSDLIEKQKELAVSVRQLIRDNRDETPAEREPLPEELQDLRSEMNSLRNRMKERHHKARDDMRGMSRREREEYRQGLLEELKELHDDIKTRRRQVIEEIREGQSGDRRPEG